MEGTRLHVSRFWDAENSLVTDSPIQSGVRNRAVRVGPVLGEPTRGRAGAPARTGTPSVRARVAVAATEHRRTFVTTVEVSWKCRERCRVCFDLTFKKNTTNHQSTARDVDMATVEVSRVAVSPNPAPLGAELNLEVRIRFPSRSFLGRSSSSRA